MANRTDNGIAAIYLWIYSPSKYFTFEYLNKCTVLLISSFVYVDLNNLSWARCRLSALSLTAHAFEGRRIVHLAIYSPTNLIFELKNAGFKAKETIPSRTRWYGNHFIAFQTFNLLFALLFIKIVTLYGIQYGTFIGWTSPSILLLTSDQSPLQTGKISTEEASWIAAIQCFGFLVSCTAFGFIANRFGRKWPLVILSIPIIVR